MRNRKKQLTGMPAILAVILGVLCPLCFIAPLLIAAGLGTTLALLVPWFKPLLIISLIAAIVAFALTFRVYKNPLPLLLTFIGGGSIYYGAYIKFEQNLIYVGGLLLLTSVGFDWWFRRQGSNCPSCRADLEHHKTV